MVGLTQRARLLGRVQGVVVQATMDTSGESSRGKVTVTATQNINSLTSQEIIKWFRTNNNNCTYNVNCNDTQTFLITWTMIKLACFQMIIIPTNAMLLITWKVIFYKQTFIVKLAIFLTCWVNNVFVVLSRLEVWQWCVTRCREWHHLSQTQANIMEVWTDITCILYDFLYNLFGLHFYNVVNSKKQCHSNILSLNNSN